MPVCYSLGAGTGPGVCVWGGGGCGGEVVWGQSIKQEKAQKMISQYILKQSLIENEFNILLNSENKL